MADVTRASAALTMNQSVKRTWLKARQMCSFGGEVTNTPVTRHSYDFSQVDLTAVSSYDPAKSFERGK